MGDFTMTEKKLIKTVKIVKRLTNVGAYKMAGSFLSNVLLQKTKSPLCDAIKV